MEAIEYASSAIARDIANLLYESRVLKEPLSASTIGELANISRSHIQIYTQTLPSSDDLVTEQCVYRDIASSLAESMTSRPGQSLDSTLLSDYAHIGAPHSLFNQNPTVPQHLTCGDAFDQSTDTLSKLLDDLTSNTQPRSASLTLPKKWATKQLAAASESLKVPSRRAKGATYAAGSEIFARSLTGGTTSTCGSSICMKSPSLDARAASFQRLCSTRSLLAELGPMLEDKRGNLDSISEQGRTLTEATSVRPKMPTADIATVTKAVKREDSSTSRESDHNRMVFVSWIPRQLRVQHGEKRKGEIHLKHLLRDALALGGLTKVLLFPPKGTHCKLVFEDADHASKFVAKYGGFFGSEPSERWKLDICRACRLDMNDSAFTNTSVTIEWAQPHFR